ncbi:MAG: polysaccharide biosynthesis/export family protein [Chthoniobacter sp.]|uniref:polysaccharide biosynthesis/export family protein n=1 Tax=Chthoniobacter sp. TaxID=2510640 RepID=UPI0032A57467
MNLAIARYAWLFCGLILLLTVAPVDAQQSAPAERPPVGDASAVVAATTSMEVLDSSRRLGAGDRLSYRVVEERRQPVGLTVADSGEVEVPLIGRVQASGRTCKELAHSIRPLLEKEYFYKATVIVGLDAVSSKARGRIYLSGQVHQQGPIEIPPDERFTLSKAILKAGGLADFANRRKIKLVRKTANGTAQTTIIDLDAITVRGELDKDPELLPDDTIIVPEKFVNF